MNEILKEMEWSLSGEGKKDILLVVKDGFPYVKNCVESIFKNTKEFNLLVWDNASDEKTALYLQEIGIRDNVLVHRSETNEGFIRPNNRLLKMSDSEWVILINSDTEVIPRWDEVMIGILKNNSELKQVGCDGGILDEKCNFVRGGSGRNVDYVHGYCFCMARNDAENFGLFDEENLSFAYCEDSDLSLRIKEKGWGVYACHSNELVRHYGSRTTFEVLKKDERLLRCIRENLSYMERRWKPFLSLYGEGRACYNR